MTATCTGGWAKTESIPGYKHKAYGYGELTYGICRLELGFQKTDGTWVYQDADFSPDTSDWQYLSASGTAPADYQAVQLNISYTRNRNTAYFDGMQLYKEAFREKYRYDEAGNLVQAIDKEQKKADYTYDPAGNLTKMVDRYGETTTYTYDSRHNLLTSTSNGTVTTYTYDSRGNALTGQTNRENIKTWYLKSATGYTDAGSFVSSRTDELGNTVRYAYDTAKGLQTAVTDAKG